MQPELRTDFHYFKFSFIEIFTDSGFLELKVYYHNGEGDQPNKHKYIELCSHPCVNQIVIFIQDQQIVRSKS